MFDSGNTGFMLVCAMLVLLMTPGLAFFYGGLSRRKNVVNTMIMVFGVLGIVAITWTIFGWSFAYGGDGSIPFFGGFDQIGLTGLVANITGEAPEALSHDCYPAMADVVFQLAFCMITTAIITGSLAGRMKYGAICAFVAIWTIVVYPPLAHMVWGGDGSLISDTIGARDFADGDVVHISSGLTGLVLCLLLGKRKGFGMMSYRPHNVPFVALGAGLLWFGWFGFNGGSEFKADAVAARMRASREAYERGLREEQAMIDAHNAGKRSKDNQGKKQEDVRVPGNVLISFSLAGRTFTYMHVPAYQCEGSGQVVVSISVNRNGKVTSASVRSATSGEECLSERALEAARLSRFNVDASAPASQSGTITYLFQRQ